MKAFGIASLAVSLAAVSGSTVFAQGSQARPAQPPATTPARPPATTPGQPPATAPAQPPAAPTPAPPPVQPPAPFPAGAKVAFINPQRIFAESADGKAALARVNTLTQKKQTENQTRQKTLQDNQQKLQASGSVMSDAARSQLEKEIEKQQLDLQRFQQDAQAEIQELQTEVQNEFARKVTPLIDQIAKEKGLHLVFNAGDAGFAWVDPGLDLSAEVIKKLDASKTPSAPK
jgi:outer membrane protein